MTAPTEAPTRPPVWQPLTFGGVAAFAHARWARLALVQGCVAVLIAATVLFMLGGRWFPVVTSAVRGMSDFGAVRKGRLAWPKSEATMLAENRFLGLAVDVEETGTAGQVADVQIEFGRERIKFVSLFGYASVPYPGGIVVEVNRQSLDPWWSAWQPAFLFVAGVGTLGWLFVYWNLLGAVYAVPLCVLGWLAGRPVSLSMCWRMGAATLLPGALWTGAAIALYAAEQLSLVGLIIAFGLHLPLAWIYLIGAVFQLPRKATEATATANPFTPASPATPAGAPERGEDASGNPFQRPPAK